MHDTMEELKNPLLDHLPGKIYVEKAYKFGAPNYFIVTDGGDPEAVIDVVKFQEGPVQECGVNGNTMEGLIGMIIHRLACFQQTDFKCRENAIALTHLEDALLWLNKRTAERKARGVEGTNLV